MKHATAIHEDLSVSVSAGAWPETAAATTDGSALGIDAGPTAHKTPWPEAAAFTTDGWITVEFDDLRR